VLGGFLQRSAEIVNTAAIGPSTNYTLTTAPNNWDGVISDLAFALAMEKLILEQSIWNGKLIFAIGPQALLDGGGDVIGALETLKSNAEERAARTLDNEMFKRIPHVSGPTKYYFDALLVGGGSRRAIDGAWFGRTRGWKPTKYLGSSL